MLTLVLIYILYNVVTIRPYDTILCSRIGISIVFYSVIFALNNFHITYLDKGIYLFDGFIIVTFEIYIIQMIIFLIFLLVLIMIIHNKHYVCRSSLRSRNIVILTQQILYLIFLFILVFLCTLYSPYMFKGENIGLFAILSLSAICTTYNIKPVFWKKDLLPKDSIINRIIGFIKHKYLYFRNNKKEIIICIVVAVFIGSMARLFIQIQLELDTASLDCIPVFLFIVYSLWMPVLYASNIVIQIGNSRSIRVDYSFNRVYKYISISSVIILFVFAFIGLCARWLLFVYFGLHLYCSVRSPVIASKIIPMQNMIKILPRVDLNNKIPVHARLGMIGFTGTVGEDDLPFELEILRGPPGLWDTKSKSTFITFYDRRTVGFAEVHYDHTSHIERETYPDSITNKQMFIYKILTFDRDYRQVGLFDHYHFNKVNHNFNIFPINNIRTKFLLNPPGLRGAVNANIMISWEKKFLTEFYFHTLTDKYILYANHGKSPLYFRKIPHGEFIEDLNRYQMFCEDFQKEKALVNYKKVINQIAAEAFQRERAINRRILLNYRETIPTFDS